MAEKQTSKRHHYTPRFLMENWVVESPNGHRRLNAFYYDRHNKRIHCNNTKGTKGYCCEEGLLNLEKHAGGDDSLERDFFGAIDDKGADVRNELLKTDGDVKNLTADQRCDWGRLLLSLEARQPEFIKKLKTEGAEFLKTELNGDSQITGAMVKHGVQGTAAEYARQSYSLEDKAIGNLQGLVDSPAVGKELINAHWYVRHLDTSHTPLILSDRPLVRINAFDSRQALWVLPLSPSRVFLAANSNAVLQKILQLGQSRFCKQTNIYSALQADKYVFSVSDREDWLLKYMVP